VTSERGKTYQVDLKTKAVTQSDLAPSQAPDTPTQLQNIPEAVAPRGEERGSQRADLLEQQALRLVSARRLAAARVELGRSISARNQNVSPPLLLCSLI
jgi:hypothetical protein